MYGFQQKERNNIFNIKNYKMNTYKLKIFFILVFTSLLFVQCQDDDDNGNAIDQENCNDGIQNGDEEGIDCGGSSCPPCDDDDGIDFGGTYVQEDVMGRPVVNTIFSGTDTFKNEYNITATSNRNNEVNDFQPVFETILENYHDIYALSLDIPVEDLNYETNILNWNANTFTRIMAYYDALQVAPEGLTTYYNSNSGLVFTGRSLSDDVVDVSLMLMFGGEDGTRLDGNNDTPQLTFDGVDSGDRDFSLPFPYLEAPLTEE
jgi:hypothetical protein